jgi:hypothetical protein
VVAHALYQVHDVARHDHRAAGLDEALEDVADVRRRDRVDRLERLVEHEQPRRMHHRTGERDLLGHTRRVVHDEGATGGLEVEQAKEVGGALRHHRPIEPVEQSRVGDELEAGEPVEQPHAVAERAELALCGDRIGPDVDVMQHDLPGVWSQQAGGHRQGRGLAGAVRADEAEERSGWHDEVEVVDGERRTERLDQSGQPQRGGRTSRGAGRGHGIESRAVVSHWFHSGHTNARLPNRVVGRRASEGG